MADAPSIAPIDDSTVQELLNAEHAALILTKSTCGSCASYQREIEDQVSHGRIKDVVIGKLTLDQPGSLQFKRSNPWVAQLESLPHTVLYRRGERVDEFSASRGSYLAERVEDAFADRLHARESA